MPETLTEIERDVLKMTAEGPVDLERMHRRLNRRSGSVRLADVADAVRALVEDGLIEPESYRHGPFDLSQVWKARFALTERGRAIFDESREPEPADGPDSPLEPIEIAVLLAAKDEPGTVDQVETRRHRQTSESERQTTAETVARLVGKGLLAPRSTDLVPSNSQETRYELTPEGRRRLTEEGPLPPPPGWAEGRLYPGVFRGLISKITREDIDEARREMWGGFARDSE